MNEQFLHVRSPYGSSACKRTVCFCCFGASSLLVSRVHVSRQLISTNVNQFMFTILFTSLAASRNFRGQPPDYPFFLISKINWLIPFNPPEKRPNVKLTCSSDLPSAPYYSPTRIDDRAAIPPSAEGAVACSRDWAGLDGNSRE